VKLAPTAPSRRLESIDVLRGAALFGVLLENMQHFLTPSYAEFVASHEAGSLDQLALWAIRFGCEDKIYLLFSYLFGYGIALQMRRAARAGAGFVSIHLWRMAALLLIGLAHMLVWTGDILSLYALLGAALLAFRGCGRTTLRATCLASLLAPTLGLALLSAASRADLLGTEALRLLEQQISTHRYPIRQACFAFAMFVFGLSTGRDGLLSDPAAFVAAARRWLVPALVLGVAANLAAVALLELDGGPVLSILGVLREASIALGTPALAFCYAFAILWGLTRPRLHAWLSPLAAVGRTSLSNYLLQTLIGVGILARTGLGPLGPIPPVAGVAISVAIFALQVAASRRWLTRFRFGPAEWLCRTLAYGEPPPLRVPPVTD
jgi:uncharacterized protein